LLIIFIHDKEGSAMKTIQNTFMRYEMKYLVTAEQRRELMRLMERYMEPDEFGRSTICNIYTTTHRICVWHADL